MGRFDGKVGFVTGGGTGIGLACARAIVDGGGRVVLAGRRGQVVEASAATLGPAADFVQCDVASDESVVSAFAAVEEDGVLHWRSTPQGPARVAC